MIVRSLVFVAAWALVASAAFAQDPRPVDGEDAPAIQAAPAEEREAAPADPASPSPDAVGTTGVLPVAPATPAAVVEAGTFRIGIDDVLDVQVWKNPDLSRVVTVRPDGFITLPLVNDVRAVGVTPTELRRQITERLAAFVPAAEVSVIVREINSFKVSITGAVRMPGRYSVASNETVLDLISRAQGLTEFAKRDRIVVHRREGNATRQLSFNYDRVAEGRDENFVVQNGDIIVVP